MAQDEGQNENGQPQMSKDERNAQNNANTIKNAADVAIASKNPYAMAAGGAVKAADKLTGGKSTEMLGEAMNKANKMTPGGKKIQNASNKLAESGAGDAIGKAASMKGGAGGAGSAGNAANGPANASNSGNLPKNPLGGSNPSNNQGGNNDTSSGGLGFPKLGSQTKLGGNDNNQSASADFIKGIKKTAKVMKFIGPAIPYILGVLAVVMIIIIIMAAVMNVKDQIGVALGQIVETSERLTNFLSGDGWNTSDEAFFKKLKQAYKDYNPTNGQPLDIPLIASTIHYNNTIDIGTFDGENFENEDEVKEEEYSEDTGSIWGNVISTYQTHAFYEVANTKLGSYRQGFIPSIGGKGLLGHLIYTRVKIVKKNCDLFDALEAWVKFFSDIIDFNSSGLGELYEINDGSVLSTAMDFLSETLGSRDGILGILTSFDDFIDKLTSFANQGQSYPSWVGRNFLYELKEFGEYLTGNYNDAHLISSTESYYNSLDGTGTGGSSDSNICNSLVDCIKDQFSEFSLGTLIDLVAGIFTGTYYVPEFIESMDYRGYYRYLVNIYLPETYYYGLELGKNFTYSDLIKNANEIFDQKYMYDYLVEEVDPDGYSSECRFNFDGEKKTVSIDNEMLNNLYVNVLDYDSDDLNGTVVETIPLEDYVIGVTYREIGASVSDNEDYLKAFMIAAKSYTVGRRTIKQNGDKYYITMKNSVNDQVYCSLTKGCLDAPSNKKGAPSSELIEKLRKIYQDSFNYFLYNSSNNKFVGSYRAKTSQCINAGLAGSCLGQLDSKDMANEGQNWKEILGYFYTDPNGLVDISSGTFQTSTETCISSGLELGEDGYYIRSTAPTPSDVWFSGAHIGTSNIGQCVWYVKGRALEVVNNSTADQTLKEQATTKIKTSYGNGADWYTNGMCDTFACGQDYTKPKPGAIGVYKWTEKHFNETGYNVNYGHVIMIEKVEGNQVWYSHGGNSCGGAGGNSSWNCVGFWYQQRSVSEMNHLGGNYEFIGYVYLLG